MTALEYVRVTHEDQQRVYLYFYPPFAQRDLPALPPGSKLEQISKTQWMTEVGMLQ